MLTREHYCAMIFYHFKVGLIQEECLQHLYLAYGDEVHLVLLYSEFCRGQSSLLDEELTGRPCQL